MGDFDSGFWDSGFWKCRVAHCITFVRSLSEEDANTENVRNVPCTASIKNQESRINLLKAKQIKQRTIPSNHAARPKTQNPSRSYLCADTHT
jgi:hypothetical protein